MIAAHSVLLPEPGSLKGIALFGATPEEAEREEKGYLGQDRRWAEWCGNPTLAKVCGQDDAFLAATKRLIVA